MSIHLVIPDDIARAAVEMASRTGSSPDSLLLDALKAHFPPIPEALAEEFDALERASDEDCLRLEQHLEAT